MKKLILFLIITTVLFGTFAHAGSDLGPASSPGPAPSSGDGVSEGSGFDGDFDVFGPGPAPSSGDGVSDGSGFTVPPAGTR